MSNTRTIAKNTGWYSVENIVSAVVTVITSIAIARTLVLRKRDTSSTWATSPPLSATSAALAFLRRPGNIWPSSSHGRQGTARLIFFRTLALQAGLASLATLAIIVWVFQDANAPIQAAAVLIALSIWPRWLTTSRRRPTARPKTSPQTCRDRSSPPSSISSRFCNCDLSLGVTGLALRCSSCAAPTFWFVSSLR